MFQLFPYRRLRLGKSSQRPIPYYWLVGGALALVLAIPIIESPLMVPSAYAHHGGGSGGGGGAGGRGDGPKPMRPGSTPQPATDEGQGKGGRGLQGLKR